MSQLSIPSREASQLPTPTEITQVTETDSSIALDPGDSGFIYRAPRALQLANFLPRHITRKAALKRTYMQAKLSDKGVY
jgi:hypothetical protein